MMPNPSAAPCPQCSKLGTKIKQGHHPSSSTARQRQLKTNKESNNHLFPSELSGTQNCWCFPFNKAKLNVELLHSWQFPAVFWKKKKNNLDLCLKTKRRGGGGSDIHWGTQEQQKCNPRTTESCQLILSCSQNQMCPGFKRGEWRMSSNKASDTLQ